jgi:hypothetical protein
MRKFRIVAVLVAVVAALGIGVGPASAKPYHFKSQQTVTSVTGR